MNICKYENLILYDAFEIRCGYYGVKEGKYVGWWRGHVNAQDIAITPLLPL